MKDDKIDKELHKKAEQWLWAEAKRHVAPLGAGAVAMLVSSYSNQMVPRLMGRLMDPASAKTEQKNSFFSSIITLGLVGGAASFTRTIMLNKAQDGIAANLRKETFASLLSNRDVDWFQIEEVDESAEDSKEGKSTEKSKGKDKVFTETVMNGGMTPAAVGVILKDDVDTAAQTISATLPNLIRSTSSFVFGTYNMISLNPQLLGLSLMVAPCVGTLAFLSRIYLKKVLAIQQTAAVNAACFIEERLNHIMMVKMSNREQDEIESYDQIQDEYVELGRKAAFANGLSMGSMFTLSTSALCGILLAGGKAVEAKRMTHGQLLSFGTYSFLLALGSAGIAKASGEYMNGIQSAARLYSLAYPKDDKKDEKKTVPTSDDTTLSFDPNKAQKITFDEVSFSYKSQPSSKVLQTLSLSLSRGEVVAIAGKNGSGKTSLAMLLSGLYSPTSGSIVVDCDSQRIDYVNALDRRSQTALIQVVPQQPALFNTSVIENVRYTNPLATDEEVSKVMIAANCEDFVSRLEGGMQYQVGRNGSKLSGGQRQRLGLARALLADPIVLVLDEPSSSLDSEGEAAVGDAIKACRAANRALLVITHNAKTLELADRVIVLKEGSIVQEGNLVDLRGDKDGELYSLMPDLH